MESHNQQQLSFPDYVMFSPFHAKGGIFSNRQEGELFISRLPEATQEFIKSENTAALLKEICEAQNLSRADIADVVETVRDISCGIKPPEYLKELPNMLLCSPEESTNLIYSLVHRVLLPVMGSAKKAPAVVPESGNHNEELVGQTINLRKEDEI